MSWNWFSISFFHAASSVADGYGPAATDQVSASRRACSALRFRSFVRDWDVYVPRCNSKYSSPDQVVRPLASEEAASKKSAARPSPTPRWCADSIISGCGPPPPSPQPNRYRERFELAPSLKLRTLRSTSSALKLPLYVSAGGKWVKIRVPSMPSQMKVWCSGLLVSFQESFWVRKKSQPASAMSCGRLPG